MRSRLSQALCELAANDERVFVLTGDHGYSLFDEFRKRFPERFINVGIAEQNLVGVAAGLAMKGFFPVIYGLASFIPGRVVEQIKLDLLLMQLPVLILGDGAGFVYSTLGVSHQSHEDIALLRSLSGISIWSPGDEHELALAISSAHVSQKPNYIRLGKGDLSALHQSAHTLSNEGIYLVGEKSPKSTVAVFAHGSMAPTANEVIDAFDDVDLYSFPRIKPLNVKYAQSLIEEYRAVLCIEEHSSRGGLGSELLETISPNLRSRLILRGTPEERDQTVGSYNHKLKQHGLDASAIQVALTDLLHDLDV